MDASRWDAVTTIFDQAMSLPAVERGAFVARVCADDEALRAEVASLLAAHEQAPDWLDGLADEIVAPARRTIELSPDRVQIPREPVTAEPSRIGTRVLHYEIVERLGAGGMGVVYRAHDERLGRQVALKFIAPSHLDDAGASRRLVREARAASRLDHPHICTIYGIEETPDGELCLAMALCDGGTLRDRLAGGSLPVGEALDLAVQIADALAHAHARGIVHRDLKPANIAFTSDGRVKLLDFGIAVLKGSALASGSAAAAGTIAYVPPEQIRGRAVDARADVWSLGVTLFEMLAGPRPFVGDDQAALLFAILEKDPPRLDVVRPDIPPPVAELIVRMLRKNRDERPPDGAAVLQALDEIAPGRRPAAEVRDTRHATERRSGIGRRLERPAVVAVVALLAVAAAAAGLMWVTRPAASGSSAVLDSARAVDVSSASRVSVAVLPFAVRGAPEFAYLREGMVDLLATTLDGVGDLRGIDPNAVLGTVARDRPPVLDPESGREVATRLGAGRYVLGSVVQLGSRLQLNAAIYDAGGRERARAQVVVNADSELMSGVDDLARQLVATELTGPVEQLAGLAAVTTHSLPALRAYLDGERLLRDARPEAAIERLREAVALDSNFALAWYRLARAAGWRGVDSLNLVATERAFDRADSLPPRARAIVGAYHELRTGDPREAERRLREVLAGHPDDAEAWLLLGEALFHNNPAQGRPTSEAREPLQRVMMLDPRNREITVHLMDLAAREQRLGALDTLFTMYFRPNSEGELLAVRHTYLTLHAQLLGSSSAADSAVSALRHAGPDAIATVLARIGPQLPDLRTARRLAAMLAEPSNSAAVRAGGVLHLALLELARGRWMAAEDAWRLAATLDPGATIVHRALASALPFFPVRRDSLLTLRATLAVWDVQRHPLTGGVRVADQDVFRHYLHGLLSIRLGDESGAREARRRLSVAVRRGADPRLASAFGASLLAHGAWRRGRAVDALTALDNAVLPWPFATRAYSPLLEQHLDRFTRAEALLALGRHDDALRWYASLDDGYGLWGAPYLGRALERRGEAYERLGRVDEARRHYERFVELWRDADPELRPRVQQIEARLAALQD